MLRRLKVRTRLIAVIAVPLLLLLAVAVPEVFERRDEAADADRAAALADDGAAVAAAVESIQSERTLSAALRAGAVDAVVSSLDTQRATTDGTVERAVAALDRLADRAPGLGPTAATATEALDSLEAIRDETDAARSIVPWRDPFLSLVDALITVQEELGGVVADADVADGLTPVGLLARSKDAAAAQAAQLAAAAAWGELRGDQAGILSGLRGDELAYRTAYLAASPAAERVDRRAEVQQGSATTAGRLVDQAIESGDLPGSPGLAGWLRTGSERQIVLRAVETARVAEAVEQAQDVGNSARRAATAYAGLAGAGLLMALAVALLAARSITVPLRRLTVAADDLAEERLPRLVEALRHPGEEDDRFLAATMEAIEVSSDDELAHLGRALNAVQAVAVDVAAEQADLLRKGISDLYVNLARRNQSLIERQIQLLDRLESGEQDPETLEHLYLLDHLATRMRRNAESLLVLAGAESGPRRARSIEIVDVVRAALSEVEDYERIDLGVVADATLQGPAVSDVAHILAELLENATHFSPPSSTVRVDGARSGGSYQIVISDRGVGMQPDQLDALNAVLRDPPVTGLALGRSLGCLVAARLAARHGITVRLRAGEHEGVSAYVILPRQLIATEATEPPATAPEPVTLHPPARLRDALPVPASFEDDLHALLEGDAPPPLVEPPLSPRDEAPEDDAAFRPTTTSPPPTVVPAAPAVAPVAPAALVPEHSPAEGLARRVPGATAGPKGIDRDQPRVRRSPDEVRALLSRYRSGLKAGRVDDTAGTEDRS